MTTTGQTRDTPARIGKAQAQMLEATAGEPDGIVPAHMLAGRTGARRTVEALVSKDLLREIGSTREGEAVEEQGDGPEAKFRISAADLRAIGAPDIMLAGQPNGIPDEHGAISAPLPASPPDPGTASDVGAPAAADASAASDRAGTKAGLIIGLLRRQEGASLDELVAAASWQAHSVRGFLSGTVKKRMGLSLTAAKDEAGMRRYRIGA